MVPFMEKLTDTLIERKYRHILKGKDYITFAIDSDMESYFYNVYVVVGPYCTMRRYDKWIGSESDSQKVDGLIQQYLDEGTTWQIQREDASATKARG